MAIELRTATPEDIPELFHADGRAFGLTYDPNDIEPLTAIMDLDRFQLATDGGHIVGVAGSFGFEVTLPGGATLPAAGVTWVSVAVTHRRQGLLRQLLDELHRGVDERGEPLAMLTASEGGIYERFGYGIATHQRQLTVDRRATRMRPEFAPAPGSVQYISHDDAQREVPALWDRFRRTRPGEISRTDAWHRVLLDRHRTPRDGASEGFHLRHADGYARYRVTQEWNDGMPAHRVQLAELLACTPDAHAALWHTLLSLDLVGPITLAKAAFDDPLPYLLENPRAVRSLGCDDNVWVRPHDVATCFGARTYGTDDRLVVEAGGQRWSIDGSPDGATCRKVRSRPDLTTDTAGLGALLLGGVRPSVLAAGRRLVARDQASLRRADAFFAAERLPFCQTGF